MDNVQEEIKQHCILGLPYRGYASPYCGAGTLIFRSPDGRDLRVDSKAELWLRPAWVAMKATIDGEIANQEAAES